MLIFGLNVPYPLMQKLKDLDSRYAINFFLKYPVSIPLFFDINIRISR